MKHEKSLLSKIMLTLGLPVALIYCLTAGIAMAVMNQSSGSFSDIQNSLMQIFAIGLVAMMGVVFFIMKKTSNTITKLAKVASQLADGDIGVEFMSDKSRDELGAVSHALAGIAENIKNQSVAAKKLADGDLSVLIIPSSDKDLMENSLLAIQKTIGRVINHLVTMPELLEREDYIDIKLAGELRGDYKKAIENIDMAIINLAKRNEFYMSVLDAMPYQISVMDINLKRIFINKTLADVMKKKGSNKIENREDFYGYDCALWNLEMCNTENCGVAAFKKTGRIEYHYEYMGEHFRMDTKDIKDKKGETFGYVEMFFNTTATMSFNNYLKTEIQRLASNLGRLAAGNMEFNAEFRKKMNILLKSVTNSEQLKII